MTDIKRTNEELRNQVVTEKLASYFSPMKITDLTFIQEEILQILVDNNVVSIMADGSIKSRI
jgi:hypothetical protein